MTSELEVGIALLRVVVSVEVVLLLVFVMLKVVGSF